MVRDKKGRFQKGVSGNPNGRPKSDVNITTLIDQCVTENDWQVMITEVARKAKRGDLKCVEWITDRRFGKPMQPVTGKDGGPIEVMRPSDIAATVASMLATKAPEDEQGR